VNVKDLVLVALHLGKKHNHNLKYDVNGDGKVGVADLLIVIRCAHQAKHNRH
jgi:hypothetical protein